MRNNQPPLEARHEQHVFMAKARLDSGQWQKAEKELHKIPRRSWKHPAVLLVRCAIFLKSQQWNEAAKMARILTKALPGTAYGWINLGYATRRKKGGGLLQAREIILGAEPDFPGDFRFPYTLACYCSQLGELNEANLWLKKAMAIDKNATLKLAAGDDDLKPLWDKIGGPDKSRLKGRKSN